MKRLIGTIVLGLAVVLSVGAEEAGPSKRIGLVNVGGFDELLFGRIAGHLSTHLKSTPQVLAPRKAAGKDDLQAEAVALAPLVDGDVVCVVGIAVMPEGVSAHGAIAPEQKTAVLNATALKPTEGDEEAYGRRLEKEAIRCAGLLLGMKPCPNPRCALRHYTDDRGLDQKGRNYCPPCQVKFETLRDAANLDVRKEAKVPDA